MGYKGKGRCGAAVARLMGCVLLCALLLAGCAKPPQTEAATPTLHVEVAQPTPTVQPIISEPEDNGDVAIREDILEAIKPKTYEVSKDTTILIYHTHAAEAYRQEGGYAYEESEEFRTLDNTKNVVAAGEALKKALESYGYAVIHDTANVEAPELESAYSRSLEVMQKYPEADIYIDLHRNAADAELKKDDVVMIGGKRCARMFFVVGTGVGTYDGEYDVRPDWMENYRFALSVMDKIKTVNPDLVLPIRTKAGRYNQHISNRCLLLELGHNANTMDDILNSVPYVAKAISETAVLQKN